MEDDLDKMARQLKAKWGAERSRPKAFADDQEERFARNLVGRVNLDRIEHQKGNRPYRPMPVEVRFEYWWVEWGFSGWHIRIERIENGRRSDHEWDTEARSAEQEIAHLRKRGFTVREVHMGVQPKKAERKEGSRKDILAKLGRFKP